MTRNRDKKLTSAVTMTARKSALEKPGLAVLPKTCDNELCGLVGQQHPRCAAHVHRAPETGRKPRHGQVHTRPCNNNKINGSNFCRTHGANTGARAEVRVMAAAVTLGDHRLISPHAALLEELYRTAGHVEWLRDRIANMDPELLVWGLKSRVDRPLSLGKEGDSSDERVTEDTYGADLNVWYQLYLGERKHLAEVSSLCLRANIEERQLKVIEAQAVILAQVIKIILGDVRLGIEATPAVQSQVVRDAMNRMELGRE